jgi:molybdopterin/thiamine biosynthesis adenylyltransferase
MSFRPAVKQSVPYFTTSGEVHFRFSGTLISLEDPDGRVLALLKLLDGRHDPDEIWRELRERYPDVTLADVRQALADLDEDRLIQDASDTGSDFNAAERERWSRNMGFFETYASLSTSAYEFQRRIRDTKIAVLGLGGMGTHVLIDLVAIGFTDIRIVDFDIVELSNLNRQVLYGESLIGQSKIDIAAGRARAFNSGIHLEAEQVQLLSADEVYRIVHDRDIVLGLADTPKLHLQHWVNEACVRAGAALIAAGVVTQRAFLYTIVPGLSGCMQCWYDMTQGSDPATRLVREDLAGTEARGERFAEDRAAFDGLVVMVAAQVVSEAVRLASQVSPPVSMGRLIEMAFHDPQLRVPETFSRRDDCAVCSGAAPSALLSWLARETRPLPF